MERKSMRQWNMDLLANNRRKQTIDKPLRFSYNNFCDIYYPSCELHMKIEQTIEIRAPIARVWEALSDHQQFGEWFRCTLDQPFKEGEWSTGQMTYPGAEHLAWEAKVLKIQPHKCLEFAWPPYVENAPVNLSAEPWLHCRFELLETDKGTLLTITESGFDKLACAIQNDARRISEQGWEIQAGHLSDYVTNNS